MIIDICKPLNEGEQQRTVRIIMTEDEARNTITRPHDLLRNIHRALAILPNVPYRPHESVSATLWLSRTNRPVSDPLDIDVVISVDVGAGLEHLRPVVQHEGVLALPGDGVLTLPRVTDPTQLEFESALRAALTASGWQIL